MSGVPENIASRRVGMSAMYLELRDWENFKAIFGPHAYIHDMRAGGATLIAGPEDIAGAFHVIADLGVTGSKLELAATSGDDLALLRVELTGEGKEVLASFAAV